MLGPLNLLSTSARPTHSSRFGKLFFCAPSPGMVGNFQLCFSRIYYNHEMTDVGKIALRTAVVERPEHFCSVGSGLAV